MKSLSYLQQDLLDILHERGWLIDCIDGGLCKKGYNNIDIPDELYGKNLYEIADRLEKEAIKA